jgi:hypothetical protein
MPCWFCAQASAKCTKIVQVDLLDTHWKYIDQFTNIDWRSANVEAVDVGLQYFGVTTYWAKLSRLCQIDQLVKIFTEPNKAKGFNKSAQEYSMVKAEELLRAKYGPGVTIERSPAKSSLGDTTAVGNTGRILVSPTQMARWFVEGLGVALGKEVEKRSNSLHTGPSKNRLSRAFQFFSQSVRLVEPHRFVGLATCLEALFCTRRTEITFQLASRLSWLLEPKDYSKRRETFKEASNLYDLRSKIVHGADFNIAEVFAQEKRLLDLCRRAFWKILSDDALFETFFNRNSKVCDDYLESLNLGCPQPGND